MSATVVVPLRDAARGAVAKAPPPLPSPKAPPSLLPSMRVPKGSVPHGETEADGDDWEALVAKAKALAAEEDADDWDSVIASARSRVADEEREWAEAMARAKRIAALEPVRSVVARRPQRPQRPARPARKPAPTAPVPAVAPSAPAAVPISDEEAEWQRMREQAALRTQEAPRAPQHAAATYQLFGAPAPAAVPAKPTPRVVAWP